MNKMMLTLAFTAMIGGSLMAQDTMQKQGHVDRSEQLTEAMTKRLKLTDEQVPKVKDINDRFAKELNALNSERKDAKTSGEAMPNSDVEAKAKDLNEKKNAELKGVLTPEQMTEWQKMQSEMKAKLQEKRQAKQAPKKQ